MCEMCLKERECMCVCVCARACLCVCIYVCVYVWISQANIPSRRAALVPGPVLFAISLRDIEGLWGIWTVCMYTS